MLMNVLFKDTTSLILLFWTSLSTNSLTCAALIKYEYDKVKDSGNSNLIEKLSKVKKSQTLKKSQKPLV